MFNNINIILTLKKLGMMIIPVIYLLGRLAGRASLQVLLGPQSKFKVRLENLALLCIKIDIKG